MKNDAQRYRGTPDTISGHHAEPPTRAAIDEASEYLDMLYSIECILRRYPEVRDLETAERYLELLIQIKSLSCYVPDEDELAQLEGHTQNAARAHRLPMSPRRA
jgi:hypothetical protein